MDSALRSLFYRNFDPSYILHHLKDVSSLEYLGGGAHFQAYFIKKREGEGQVVKLARESFYEDRVNYTRWQRAMNFIKGKNISLLPPFEMLDIGGIAAYVLPFGEKRPHCQKTLSALALLWQRCREDLKEEGLKLHDLPQVRWHKDTPFIVDWSDLR